MTDKKQEYVRLEFKCKGLANKDLLGKSDPVVLVHIQNSAGTTFDFLGRTEVIKNNLNPVFKDAVNALRIFQKKQILRFTVLDSDAHQGPIPEEYKENMAEADLLGRADATIEQIFGQAHRTLSLKLTAQQQNKDYGELIVMGLSIEDDSRVKDELVFRLKGIDLDPKDKVILYGNPSNDPFYRIFRIGAENKQLFESKVINNTCNPEWEEQRLNMQELCGSNIKIPFHIKLFDYDTSLKIDPIGHANLTVEDLLTEKVIQLIDHHDPPRPEIQAGSVQAIEACIRREPNFDDYSSTGLAIKLSVAVDFTSSNLAHSLHAPGSNPYHRAIKSIEGKLPNLNEAQDISAYGFGGVLPGQTEISHTFPLNLKDEKVSGIQGLLDAYTEGLSKLTLGESTSTMSRLIQNVASEASNSSRKQDQLEYQVLLILTDGDVSDFDQVTSDVIEASQYPMSIIVAGIPGEEDTFKQWKEIQDGVLTKKNEKTGKLLERRTLSFLLFDKAGEDAFAQNVVQNIQDQLLSYYTRNNISPILWKQASHLPFNFKIQENMIAKA